MNALSIGLNVNEALKDLFGDRVYPQYAGIDTPTPFAVYNRDAIMRDYDKDGISLETVQVGISIVSNTYGESIALAEQVDERMHSRLGAHLESAGEAFSIEDKLYIQELNYKIEL